MLLLVCACASPAPGPAPGAGGAGGGGAGAGGSGGEGIGPSVCPPLTRFEGPACGPGGCWEHPAPAPLDFLLGGEDASGALWIAGEGTPPLRWDGERSSFLGEGLPHPTAPITALHVGQAPHLVQDGRVFRLEGERWTEVDRGRFPFRPNAIWADERALWLAGPEVRRDAGAGWESLPVVGYGPFHALWGAEGAVWAAGAQGAVFKWEGAWERFPTGTENGLRSVWGSSRDDVWFGGEAGTMLRYAGDGLLGYDLRTGATIHSIAGTGPDDVLALGYDATEKTARLFHWNGSFWRELPPIEDFVPRGLWSSGEGIWVGGEGAALALWTGSCFRVKSGGGARLNDLWAGTWAVGDEGLALRRTDEGWERQDLGVTAHLRSVWGWAGEVWVAGEGGTLLRGDEAGFRPVHGTGDRDLLAMHGREGGPLWIGASDGSLFQTDGRSLRRTPSPSEWPIVSLLAFGGEAWATTEAGEVLRWDGEAWRYQRRAHGRAELFGTAPDDLWLAGFDGEAAIFERWDGEAWRVVMPGTATAVYAIAGAGDELWVGHAPGMIRHWDGARWSAHYLGTRPRALAHDGEDLWILSDRRLYRWGEGAPAESHPAPVILTALHAADGAVWVGTATGAMGRLGEAGLALGEPVAEHPIRSIHGHGEALWAVGDAGTLLRFDGEDWRPQALGTEADLRAVAVAGEHLWIASSEGLLHRRDGQWRWWGGVPANLRTLWSEGALVYVANAEGGVYAIDPEGSGILYTIHPSFSASAIWRSADDAVWFGGEPSEDGLHFMRFGGESSERIDLGVTMHAISASALSRGEAIVAAEEQLFVLDPGGVRRPLGIPFGAIRSFSRQEGALVPTALGRAGGILRLHLLEYAP